MQENLSMEKLAFAVSFQILVYTKFSNRFYWNNAV